MAVVSRLVFSSRRLGISVLCFSLIGSLALAQNPPLRATVSEIKNKVDKRQAEKTRWQSAQVQDILQVDNSVRTGHDAIAELTYQDSSITRLAPNTTLTLQQEQHRILHLLLGKIWVRISKSAIKTRIKTPSAIATVIGTDVLASVDPDQTSTFTVLNTDPGHQLVVQGVDPTSNMTIGGQSTAGSAQQVVVDPGHPASVPQTVNVQQILQQQESGFVPGGQAGTTTSSSVAPSSEPSASPSSQPSAAPSVASSTAPTAAPLGVVPTVGPVVSPTPTMQFNPVHDAPVLPSQEIDRTGSNITGRVNVILEHDGPPRP